MTIVFHHMFHTLFQTKHNLFELVKTLYNVAKIFDFYDFIDEILLIQWRDCYVGTCYVNIPVTRFQCSTRRTCLVLQGWVGPEPVLDIRSEPPPPPAGTSPSSWQRMFRVCCPPPHVSTAHSPFTCRSNCQDKQFDLQTWTSCLNVSAILTWKRTFYTHMVQTSETHTHREPSSNKSA